MNRCDAFVIFHSLVSTGYGPQFYCLINYSSSLVELQICLPCQLSLPLHSLMLSHRRYLNLTLRERTGLFSFLGSKTPSRLKVSGDTLMDQCPLLCLRMLQTLRLMKPPQRPNGIRTNDLQNRCLRKSCQIQWSL